MRGLTSASDGSMVNIIPGTSSRASLFLKWSTCSSGCTELTLKVRNGDSE